VVLTCAQVLCKALQTFGPHVIPPAEAQKPLATMFGHAKPDVRKEAIVSAGGAAPLVLVS
jgi:hypothetical protein